MVAKRSVVLMCSGESNACYYRADVGHDNGVSDPNAFRQRVATELGLMNGVGIVTPAEV